MDSCLQWSGIQLLSFRMTYLPTISTLDSLKLDTQAFCFFFEKQAQNNEDMNQSEKFPKNTNI